MKGESAMMKRTFFLLFLHAQQIALATLDRRPYVGSDIEDVGFTDEIVRTVLERRGHSGEPGKSRDDSR